MTAADLLAAEIDAVLSSGLTETEEARAQLVYTDTVGCIRSGLADPQVAAFADRLPAEGQTEPVTGRCHPSGDLAMLLGFAAAADELDEGHYEAGGHPAAPVVAAILAENAREHHPPATVLRAFVAGYEAGGRLGRALALRRDVHPHGTWGCVGAALAVAVLRDTPPADWPGVIDLAASLATATSFDTPLLGGSVRSAWIGVSARNGLLACDLEAAGVTAGARATERILGTVLAEGLEPARLTRKEGAPLLHMTNFMKLEATCREPQAALAALDMALAGRKIATDTIAAIEVQTFADAVRLDLCVPANKTAARFSIPAVIAARLIQGNIAPDCFSEKLLTSDEFRRLTFVTQVVSCEDVPGQVGTDRSTRVLVTLSDGTRAEGFADVCAGDPTAPLLAKQLDHKFATNLSRS